MGGDGFRIPGYRVRLTDVTGGKEKVLEDRKFVEGPGADSTFIDHHYGPEEWDRVRIRQKTFEGGVLVTFRNESSGDATGKKLDAAPGKPVDMNTFDGVTFRVAVEALPEDEWQTGDTLKFKPPKATIQGTKHGWLVTFYPQQYPCVATLAVDAKGSKDERIPSFPFPSDPEHEKGSYLLRLNKFGAVAGGLVRLGVRGAGMSATVALPKAGKTVEIGSDAFKVQGITQKQFLSEDYVFDKYEEKDENGDVEYD